MPAEGEVPADGAEGVVEGAAPEEGKDKARNRRESREQVARQLTAGKRAGSQGIHVCDMLPE